MVIPFGGLTYRKSDEEFPYRQRPNTDVPNQHRAKIAAEVGELKANGTRPSLSRDAQRTLGKSGARRFEEFTRYPLGWYGGRGKKLSIYSVAVFEGFVTHIPMIRERNPALFLTLDGNLSLGFSGIDETRIELEFFPDKIEYYFESNDEEGSVGLARATELAARIQTSLA